MKIKFKKKIGGDGGEGEEGLGPGREGGRVGGC